MAICLAAFPALSAGLGPLVLFLFAFLSPEFGQSLGADFSVAPSSSSNSAATVSAEGSGAGGAAEGFLRRREAVPLPADILEELERALGGGDLFKAAEGRLEELEDAMRPIHKSLPKAQNGRLPASGVRYLLHRVFVARHTWFVRGVENTGEGWNISSPSEIFVEGGDVDDIFGSRLEKGGGLDLRETAALAAALEGLVHSEFLERLAKAYEVASMAPTMPAHASYGDEASHEVEPGLSPPSEEQRIEAALDSFMLMYVLAVDHRKITTRNMPALWRKSAKYPHWNATKVWAREVRKEVVSASLDERGSHSTNVQVVTEMMDRYGRWQNHECASMKHDLMSIEWAGTGRVRLQDFYGAALNGKWLFSEKKAYLREQGCLDESNPSQPAVLIANYINSPTNCLADSKYYSVCCINECEALLGPIERQVAAPEALPMDIVEVVEQLPSATVEAPRKLPSSLHRRLEEIASFHGGKVPLHGRLFAQWMHHAFPRECPFPHLAGTTSPLRGRDWEDKMGQRALLNKAGLKEEFSKLTEQESASASEAALDGVERCELPWSREEELLLVLPLAPRASSIEGFGYSSPLLRTLRDCAKVLAAVSLAAVVLNTARSSLRSAFPGAADKDKYTV